MIRTNGDSSSAVVLVSASTGLPVAESLAQHVEHLLNATAAECTLFDEDGNQVPSEHLVEQCLLPRATTMTYPPVRKLCTTMVAPAGIPVLVALCKEVRAAIGVSLPLPLAHHPAGATPSPPLAHTTRRLSGLPRAP